MQQHSLISKLCLLTLHFPRLRIIWSRSLHATADIFRALKTNQEEPDPVSAAAVGEANCIALRPLYLPCTDSFHPVQAATVTGDYCVYTTAASKAL